MPSWRDILIQKSICLKKLGWKQIKMLEQKCPNFEKMKYQFYEKVIKEDIVIHMLKTNLAIY